MGVEQSHTVSPTLPPTVLDSRDLKSVAKFILSGECQKIVFLCGAGISTSAGIPDFRTPGTGLYYNLQALNLPSPEAVFDISYFRTNPQPFYTLAKSLNPDNYTPTITHAFISLVARKGLLHKCFTQNIDTLERRAGVPAEKLVEAHGSFSSSRCIDCRKDFPHEFMEPHFVAGTVPRCDGCGGLVKPGITFFGEALPSEFHDSVGMVEEAELVVVMGSSLRVFPFSMLPERSSETAVRLLINNERTGGIGSRRDDVVVIGSCDEGVRTLAAELDWLQELETLWTSLGGKLKEDDDGVKLTIDEQIGKLTREVEQGLNVADQFKTNVQAELKAQQQQDPKETDKEAGRANVNGG